jgi:hypothetical protein
LQKVRWKRGNLGCLKLDSEGLARTIRFVSNQFTPHFSFQFMKKPYNLTAGFTQRLRQLGLTALLAGGATVAAHAQFTYTTGSATNLAGTYTDLGTNGTAISTANTDDANSAAQNIGFTFNYNGVAFTQFVLNTNGLIRLGANAPSSALAASPYSQSPETGIINSTDAADVNLIMPFSFDLTAGTSTPEYRVFTTGTAGSRICTIQWKNVADKAVAATAAIATTVPTQFTNFAFQVKLYEATNQIDFVYNTAAVGATDGLKYATVGLKGSSNAAGQDLLTVKGSAAAWNTTTFFSGAQGPATTTNAHNFRSTFPPDAGRTYRFRPLLPNDAAVGIFTYGKLSTNVTAGHAVQAVVTNAGLNALTNVAATLNVTGANTFTDTKTVATLAAGASAVVTFNSYPTTLNAGTNTVTVTLPSDDNTANNTATYGQLVQANQVSYLDQTGTLNAGGVGVGFAGGALAAKYTLSSATTLSDVTLTFAASTGNASTYQVVIYDATGAGATPGTVLYTSATQTRTAAAGPVTLALPGVAVPTTFYIGVKELVTNPALAYQVEDPLRPNTYYFSQDAATGWTLVNTTVLRTRLAIEFTTSTPACAAPTAVTVTNPTATGATVAFTAATSGVSGYQVIYGPTGFNPATGGTTVTTTTSPVTLTGLTAGTTYQVYVRSNCTAGGTSATTAAVSFSTACGTTAPVTTFPYNENFDTVLSGQTVPCGITVLDANADGATWRSFAENPFSGTNAMRYQGSFLNNVVANDWFFTPALVLPGTANTRYQVAFRYRAAGTGTSGTSNFTESLEVKSGTAATVAGQTNLLYTNSSINNIAYAQANGSSTPVVAYLPAGASTQYVGFHVISAANQGNLYIDDLSVTAVTVTGTSEALLRAVNVFPNPSTNGVFNLAINGANAKQALEVEVTNNLGQRVYVGSARDNFTSQIDLSRLATGLYHLKVKNGDEYMLRQISIVK